MRILLSAPRMSWSFICCSHLGTVGRHEWRELNVLEFHSVTQPNSHRYKPFCLSSKNVSRKLSIFKIASGTFNGPVFMRIVRSYLSIRRSEKIPSLIKSFSTFKLPLGLAIVLFQIWNISNTFVKMEPTWKIVRWAPILMSTISYENFV